MIRCRDINGNVPAKSLRHDFVAIACEKGMIMACGSPLSIRKILRHGGLWHDPPPRGPPGPTGPCRPERPTHDADGGITCEVDPDLLEHARREVFQQ